MLFHKNKEKNYLKKSVRLQSVFFPCSWQAPLLGAEMWQVARSKQLQYARGKLDLRRASISHKTVICGGVLRSHSAGLVGRVARPALIKVHSQLIPIKQEKTAQDYHIKPAIIVTALLYTAHWPQHEINKIALTCINNL